MTCKLDNKTITHVITKLLCTAQCKLEAWAERTRTMLGTVRHNEYQLQPQQPQAQLTQLNPASINALGNQAIKAYVVETDVTTNQQRIKAIQQRARFD